MTSTALEPAKVIAVAFLAGFAIQQLLQILDLVITPLLIRGREHVLGLAAADYKKCVMYLIAFFSGWGIAWQLQINLLDFAVPDAQSPGLGYLVSGFVLGSGTEAANTLIKYFGYLKDARKNDVDQFDIPTKVHFLGEETMSNINPLNAAATRVAIALTEATDKFEIVSFGKKCRVTTKPEDAFNQRFSDFGLDDNDMELFRKELMLTCPEIKDSLKDKNSFKLKANLRIMTVVDSVAVLLASLSEGVKECFPKGSDNVKPVV